MPGIGQSNYGSAAQALALVQDLCNDPQGQLYTAAFCLQALNSGARYVARELKNRGKTTLIEDEFLVTIPAILETDPTQQVLLTFNGITGNVTPAPTPALPANLVEPLVLWERPSGLVPPPQLVKMRDVTDEGGLPKRNQGSRLREWEWRGDQLCFMGALQPIDVIIRFNSMPNVFTVDNQGNMTGSLADLDSLDATSYYAASQLLPKRGGFQLGQQYETEAAALVEQLATSTTRTEQMAPVRMRPFGGRRGRGWPTSTL
ncbi:MAG TPA: hypothetical protein VIW68_12675 [Candidatus Sulfotelmatobacter sp.]